MPSWRVLVTRAVVEEAELDVEASSFEGAIAQATTLAHEAGDGPDWSRVHVEPALGLTARRLDGGGVQP